MKISETVYKVLCALWIILGIVALIVCYITTNIMWHLGNQSTRLTIIMIYILIIASVVFSIFLSYVISLCLYAFGQNNCSLRELTAKRNGTQTECEVQFEAQSVPEPQPEPTKKICPKCNHENELDAAFCELCGARLE